MCTILMDLDTVRATLAGPMNPFLESRTYKPAAVLVFIHGERPHVVMTEKSKEMRLHAGEMSFPGGKPESSDRNLCDTALRETKEELGFEIGTGDVIGQLDVVHTLNSRYSIMPFVAVTEILPKLHPNMEVENVYDIPLEPLLCTLEPDHEHGLHQDMFTFRYGDKIVWGATARILYQICGAIRQHTEKVYHV